MILEIKSRVVNSVEEDHYELSIQGHPVECIVIDPYLRSLSVEETERRIQYHKDVCLPILRRNAIKRGASTEERQTGT